MTYDMSYRRQNGKTIKVYSYDDPIPSAPARQMNSEAVLPGISVPSRNNSGVSGRKRSGAPRSISAQNSRSKTYTRVKSGELKRRGVSRVPDMSNPNARVKVPSVSIGTLPKKATKAVPVATVHVEPTVHTVKTAAAPFPITTLLLALVCTALLMFTIYNFVIINEYTVTVSNLKNQVSSLAAEEKELSLALDRKNDLLLIEQIASEELGMVKLDQVSKKYITLEKEDKIEVADDSDTENINIFGEIMSAMGNN